LRQSRLSASGLPHRNRLDEFRKKDESRQGGRGGQQKPKGQSANQAGKARAMAKEGQACRGHNVKSWGGREGRKRRERGFSKSAFPAVKHQYEGLGQEKLGRVSPKKNAKKRGSNPDLPRDKDSKLKGTLREGYGEGERLRK